MSIKSLETIKEQLKSHGQEHIIPFLSHEGCELHKQLNEVEIPNLQTVFDKAMSASDNVATEVFEPPKDVSAEDVLSGKLPKKGSFATNKLDISEETMRRITTTGCIALSKNKGALVVMAGGQGTRLGYDGPKGAFPLYPSGESLFCILMNKLKLLVKVVTNSDAVTTCHFFHVYIMVSDINEEATIGHFEANRFFGYPRECIHFFRQNVLPTMTPTGKMIMETATRLAVNPNGNGGIYKSLEDGKMIEHMKQTGIEFLHIIAVDNALNLPLDPLFMGYCLTAKLKCGNKCVERTEPSEKVGVSVTSCRDDGHEEARVVEYCELPKDASEAMSTFPDGKSRLYFNCGNIANHFMTVDFVDSMTEGGGRLEADPECLHAAYKKCNNVNAIGKVDCVKIEMFIFDAFKHADRVGCLVVSRDEFAPLKNKTGPDSARDVVQRISNIHKSWLQSFGTNIDCFKDKIVLLPVTASYNGEGLDKITNKNLIVR